MATREYYTVDRSPQEVRNLWDWAIKECKGKIEHENPYAMGVLAAMESSPKTTRAFSHWTMSCDSPNSLINKHGDAVASTPAAPATPRPFCMVILAAARKRRTEMSGIREFGGQGRKDEFLQIRREVLKLMENKGLKEWDAVHILSSALNELLVPGGDQAVITIRPLLAYPDVDDKI